MKRNLVEQSKTKKLLFIFFFLAVISLLIFVALSIYQNINKVDTTKQSNLPFYPSIVAFKRDDNFLPNASFSVKVADTDEERSLGLMNRSNLDDNSGMLFIFNEEQNLNFWMKNTLIPLDMIFIGKDMKVKKIYENTIPLREDLTYSSVAQYVLEINGGVCNKLNLKEGDTIVLQSIIN